MIPILNIFLYNSLFLFHTTYISSSVYGLYQNRKRGNIFFGKLTVIECCKHNKSLEKRTNLFFKRRIEKSELLLIFDNLSGFC